MTQSLLSAVPQRKNPPRIAADGFSSETNHFDKNTTVDRTGQSVFRRFIHRTLKECWPHPEELAKHASRSLILRSALFRQRTCAVRSRVSKDGRNVWTRVHPSRRAQGRAPQDEAPRRGQEAAPQDEVGD